MTSWEQHVSDWSSPPVDDVGYFPSSQLVQMPEGEFRTLVDTMRQTRYNGWRNHDNKWRDVMGLDSLQNKDIIDFGCGMSVDSLELALAGNRVSLADLSESNLALGTRVLGLYDLYPAGTYLVSDEIPYLSAPNNSFDVFYCNGVLHHVRWPRDIMERAHDLLRDGGEVRLMVYSDRGWRNYIGTEPPVDTEKDPNFNSFVRVFDQVGSYADWYNREKLDRMFGDLFEITRFEYITDNDRYLAAVLRKREV